jgi:hypothetical protein
MEAWMKRINLALALLLASFTLGVSTNASAQRWDWDSYATQNEFRSFTAFMRDHPWIARKLWEKPQRVNDFGFLNGNKELKQWLEDHPAAAQTFHQDPVDFMDRERHFEIYGSDFAPGPAMNSVLARFDWFLDSHPDIRVDLMRRPRLVDDGRYLDRHPDLREYLYRHPEVRNELQSRPREFVDREARYEHGE